MQELTTPYLKKHGAIGWQISYILMNIAETI